MSSDQDNRRGIKKKLVWGSVLVGILALGGFMAWLLATTGPEAERTDGGDEPRAERVKITRVTMSDNPVRIQGHGTVQPARRVTLVPQVSGAITNRSDSFRPGGFLDAGDTILQIDRDDYRLAVQQSRSDLERAKSELAITQSNQAVAKDEYQRIRNKLDIKNPDVVLKKPQVRSARASVNKAKAALEKAKLDLERTSIESPFDAHVTERHVEIGTNVSRGQPLATIVGTDEYWIRLSIPTSKVHWLMTKNGRVKNHLPVRISNETAWKNSQYRNAYVKDVIKEVETKGRMAEVLVAVDDPLALSDTKAKKPRMMVGSYVRGSIKADSLPGSIQVDRDLIHQGNKVWLVTPENTLEIREVDIAFRGEDHVLVTEGLRDGSRVIQSKLSAPIEGMPLEIEREEVT